MRVLVTGAAGFVGWHVVREFEGAGWEVLPLDEGDVLPGGSFIATGVPSADVVVSLAATANPADAIRNPVYAYSNSTQVMVQTMDYARTVGARVLHVSTNEAHPPVGPYGGAKACQEVIASTYPDVQTTIVVTQSLFGEHQQPNKFVPTAIRNILARRKVPVQYHAGRSARRPFLYVGHLARALRVLADEDLGRLRVHIGAGQSVTVEHVAHVLGLALSRKTFIQTVEAGDRPGHELDVRPIGWDLKEYRPGTSLEDALWNVAAWYRDNQERLEAA